MIHPTSLSVVGRPAPFLVGCALLFLVGCAGHAARTEGARTALDLGRPGEALTALNEELEVESEKALPEEVTGDNALLLLDRAMVLQELNQTKLSSRDLEVADKQIEMLDFSRGALDDIGKYLFSDDTGPYKAPPYEKLMINTVNLVNYLVRGDLGGARVEARRLAVLQKYFKDHEEPADALLGPGSYLAGFAFEKSGNTTEALRYYDEALAYGDYRTLRAPIQRLAARDRFRTPRLDAVLAENEAPGASTARATGAEPRAAEPGEILAILSYGRVPAKIAKRIPIGLALTYAAGAISPHDRARANQLAAQGLVTWVNFPELGKARGEWETPEFYVNSAAQDVETAIAVDREARRSWDRSRGTVVASAITRMLSRVVAGEAVRQTSGEGVLGALLSLGTQATLTAVDTPDTRSWATLPARIALARVEVPPGAYDVRLRIGIREKAKRVRVAAGGFAAVHLTVLR